jgi:hypothetical protein
VIGVVGAFEVKRGANSGEWHPHCHMFIVYRGRLDAQAMKDEWEMLTKDSHVLRIDPVKHPDSPEIDFMEIFKYAVKFAEMTRADNVEAFLILRGRRLIFSAGAFWGVKVPESLLDEPDLDDLPFTDLFYRYLNGTYTLDAAGSPHEWVFAKPDTDEAVDAYKALRGVYHRK